MTCSEHGEQGRALTPAVQESPGELSFAIRPDGTDPVEQHDAIETVGQVLEQPDVPGREAPVAGEDLRGRRQFPQTVQVHCAARQHRLDDVFELVVRPLEGERADVETLDEPEERARSPGDTVNLTEQKETGPLERSGRDRECPGRWREIGQSVVDDRSLERRAPCSRYRSRRQRTSVSGRNAATARYGASATSSGRCGWATVGPLPRSSRALLTAEPRLPSS